MKLLHISDLHLGRTLMEFDLYEDQRYILNQILDTAERVRADALFISGDIYDRANPGDQAMNLLDELLSDAAKRGLNTYVISGNHDSDDKLNFGRRFFEKNHVHIYSVFDGTLHHEILNDEFGTVNIWMLPFVKASQVRHYYPDEQIDTYEDAVRVILDHADINPDERNLLLAHQFVAGGGKNERRMKSNLRTEAEEPSERTRNDSVRVPDELPVFGGSESASVRNVGNVEKIGFHLFDSFEYAALGHIHSPQRVGREEVRYSGSPLKYSLSEVSDRKSVPVVTIGEKGTVLIELLPLEPLRDLRHLRGTKEQLLNPEIISDPDDFIYVTLTDEELIDDAMGIFQQYYPNTLKIDYDNSHTRNTPVEFEDPFSDKPLFEELVSDFYLQIYGTALTDQERSILKEAAKEAGISDETD